MADHEDYLPGETPSPHKTTHQDGGADEISVAGLSGELADDQPPKAHDLGGAKHNADTLADLNTKVSDATLDDSGDPRTPSAHKVSHQALGDDEISLTSLSGVPAALSDHAALPTVHQDAPALIETHRLAAAAHHAKYTDAEARALWSPMSIGAPSFIPYYDTYDWMITGAIIKNRAALTTQYYTHSLVLPNGITITKLTFYGYRDDALSDMILRMYRYDGAEGAVLMSNVTANWVDGHNSLADTTISSPLIDTDNYTYNLYVLLNPNDNVNDVRFTMAKLEFTG